MVGFTGSEWVGPGGGRLFPCVLEGGSRFLCFDDAFRDLWGFAVEVK